MFFFGFFDQFNESNNLNKKSVFIFGDYNIDISKSNPLNNKYLEAIVSNNLGTLNRDPNRSSDHSDSCIDHVITNAIN